MLAGFARRLTSVSPSRAGLQAGLASLLLLLGAGSVKDASAVGDSRTLTFHHTHSDENLTVTFKRNGRYDEEALGKINHFLRDWRSQEKTTMDRRLFDILWEVYRDVDGKQPIKIISAYRSPATNAMLRRRSSGVARFSQHTLGHAMDFYIPGVPLEQIRAAGLRLQRGGVGFYPTSGSPFVHLDTGNIRHWPRMSPDQLARVFPDGRTVHLPTDGTPLKGYQLALADIQKRGTASDATDSGKPGFLASLFGGKAADEDDEGAAPVSAKPAPAVAAGKATAVKIADVKPAELTIVDSVPLPRAKPAAAGAIQLAAADQAVPAAKPATSKTEARPQTPADIINARGFWDDMPLPQQATPAQVAALQAREAVADPSSTASVSDRSMQAMAYAPPPLPKERAPIVASAPIPLPRGARPASAAANPMAVNSVTTVIGKSAKGHRQLAQGSQGSVVTTSARLTAASRDNDIWLRAMILARSAASMTSTVFGESDMTILRSHFTKPQATVAMAFSDDPQQGPACDQFAGQAVVTLSTTPFTTASLR
uniref:Murein endopeptidase K n=1 Tax=Rhodopseudomonas palustris (strain BisA53) TaxID=316055 RepID=Q07J52_RHOP5